MTDQQTARSYRRLPGVHPRATTGSKTSLSFNAMGTTVVIEAQGHYGPAREMAAELRRLETGLTRFHESPVTQLNRAGKLSDPEPVLLEALTWAVEACRLSDGLVTPLIGRLLEWHGYRQSWTEGAGRGAGWEQGQGEQPAVPGISQLRLSPSEVVLPAGAAIDLGGTAKGWAVERVAAGRHDVIIDAGGDVLVDSRQATEVNLLGGAEEWHLTLPPGRWGVATSSVARRAWRGAHHLIDPRTGRPSESPWVQATVVGRSLKRAEVATKLLLFGAPVPAALQVERAWVVDRAGDVFEQDVRGVAHGAASSFVPAS